MTNICDICATTHVQQHVCATICLRAVNLWVCAVSESCVRAHKLRGNTDPIKNAMRAISIHPIPGDIFLGNSIFMDKPGKRFGRPQEPVKKLKIEEFKIILCVRFLHQLNSKIEFYLIFHKSSLNYDTGI